MKKISSLLILLLILLLVGGLIWWQTSRENPFSNSIMASKNPDLVKSTKQEKTAGETKGKIIDEDQLAKKQRKMNVSGDIKAINGRKVTMIDAETQKEYGVEVLAEANLMDIETDQTVGFSDLKVGGAATFRALEPIEDGTKQIQSKSIIVLK